MVIVFVLVVVGFGILFLIFFMLLDVNGLLFVFIGFIMLFLVFIIVFLGWKGGKLVDDKGNLFLFYIVLLFLVGGFIIFLLVVGMLFMYI